jgi:hypothetical protein
METKGILAQRLIGDFLVTKREIGRTLVFTAYKRIYGNQFKTKYQEVKTHQGVRYGKMTSERILIKDGVNSFSVNLALNDLKEKIYNGAYKAIILAYPEAKDGMKQQGLITLIKELNNY